MTFPASRISSVIILIAFLFSLIPHSLMQRDNAPGLESLISQIQQLQNGPEESPVEFRVIFSHTITTLRSTAELGRILCAPSTSSKSEKIPWLVTVKLPYLLPSGLHFGSQFFTGQLLSERWQQFYTSHIISPEIDPPIPVTC